jgi:hypothetical protein
MMEGFDAQIYHSLLAVDPVAAHRYVAKFAGNDERRAFWRETFLSFECELHPKVSMEKCIGKVAELADAALAEFDARFCKKDG